MKRIALVTGGGTGIGLGIARALSADGWTVVISGRRLDVLQKAAYTLSAETGREILPLQADVSDPASVAALFDQIRSTYGRIDLLVNNAGMSLPAIPTEDVSFEQWSTVVSVNLNGVFLCTQQAVRLMKEQSPGGGRIINNGSISAHAPRPHTAAYTATKHAVTGLTKATALDGRAHNIACGQIDIGNAATDMTTSFDVGILQANGETAPEAMMNVTEAARAVVYMASLPLSTNVLTMTVMATKMPFVGRG